MIEIIDVHKSFGHLKVLKGVSMSVHKGEVVVIIGASGSGKSTLLQCINGLEPLDSGQIIVDGIDVHAPKTNLNKLRRRIGIVFQSFNVFPQYTVLDNVSLAPRIVLGMSRKQAAERAHEQICKVGLSDKADVHPGKLSGGQQQRLAIARALAMEPDYMLFDEITSALDPELVGEVLDTLRMLSRDGMTMIVVTHEIPFAREVANRIVFFDSGVICESGSPQDIVDRPKNERTRQFLRKVL